MNLDIVMAVVACIVAVIAVGGICWVVIGGTIGNGEEYTIEGYLNAVEHDTGYYSQTMLIIDNQSYIFYPMYKGTAYLNQRVIVTCTGTMAGKSDKILSIEKE
jgi:hypothetical protein